MWWLAESMTLGRVLKEKRCSLKKTVWDNETLTRMGEDPACLAVLRLGLPETKTTMTKKNVTESTISASFLLITRKCDHDFCLDWKIYLHSPNKLSFRFQTDRISISFIISTKQVSKKQRQIMVFILPPPYNTIFVRSINTLISKHTKKMYFLLLWLPLESNCYLKP